MIGHPTRRIARARSGAAAEELEVELGESSAIRCLHRPVNNVKVTDGILLAIGGTANCAATAIMSGA
jgi:hypothetical protein